MRFQRLILALGAGVAVFLVTGVIVTELTSRTIEFSLLVGIPLGLLIGLVTTAFVYAGLDEDAPPEMRRVVFSVAIFGISFLLGLGVVAGVLRVRNSLALPIAVVVGLISATIVYVWLRVSTDRTSVLEAGS